MARPTLNFYRALVYPPLFSFNVKLNILSDFLLNRATPLAVVSPTVVGWRRIFLLSSCTEGFSEDFGSATEVT